MAKITVSNSVVDLLTRKGIVDKTLLLVTDDGGGDYSLQGGACSIGSKFSIVVLEQPDPAYPIKMANNANLNLYTSKYDLMFFSNGLKMDFKDYAIILKDDSGMLDGSVLIANGQEILDAFKQGITANGQSC
ncbi:iron-sulfur cluster biosynthesis family protein [Agrilactobacillus fermenti]|uniref:iron-sulfur cluster biosynthesis family protein n=1 Tax=Agrilactobacillus fermenti TaxID=2586909 RepID=UPI001E318BC2|nr:iron-sulfur cluster biosynthesis family protein [Agrilactobacillus fermenti]MCD2256460.1 iron-sulfur cluster biosynthesis family protein [Agrilactobacillus fermenti]